MRRFYLREALHWSGDMTARERDTSRHYEPHELKEAWEAWAQYEDWTERDWAYQHFVVGLSPEDARTESAAAWERSNRETTIEKVREYGIREGDPFWGATPLDERRELIRAAGKPLHSPARGYSGDLEEEHSADCEAARDRNCDAAVAAHPASGSNRCCQPEDKGEYSTTNAQPEDKDFDKWLLVVIEASLGVPAAEDERKDPSHEGRGDSDQIEGTRPNAKQVKDDC